MKEEIVSLETAKLSKHKGFDWRVIDHYKGDELIHNGALYNFNNPEEQAMWNIELSSAPTQSLLQKWLREVHNIHINIEALMRDDEIVYCYDIVYFIESLHVKICKIRFTTYELALEEALKEALKLIKL